MTGSIRGMFHPTDMKRQTDATTQELCTLTRELGKQVKHGLSSSDQCQGYAENGLLSPRFPPLVSLGDFVIAPAPDVEYNFSFCINVTIS